MRRWVSEQDAIDGWLTEMEARAAEGRAPVAVCMHCYEDLDEATIVECGGEDFCSTRCAVAYITYGHVENCGMVECCDNAPVTLPSQICAFCDEPTGGPTAHGTCRDRARRALEGQEVARARFAS